MCFVRNPQRTNRHSNTHTHTPVSLYLRYIGLPSGACVVASWSPFKRQELQAQNWHLLSVTNC